MVTVTVIVNAVQVSKWVNSDAAPLIKVCQQISTITLLTLIVQLI